MKAKSTYNRSEYMQIIKTTEEIDKKIKQLSDLEKMYSRYEDAKGSERLKVIQGQIKILRWVLGDYDIDT